MDITQYIVQFTIDKPQNNLYNVSCSPLNEGKLKRRGLRYV